MNIFSFMLDGSGDALSSAITIGGIVLLVVVFYFFMIRPQRKQEKRDAEMRNALMVGDEVTTIGGIIGKVVSIKEETFVLETTKDRTKIRFLKGAIRSVDVKVADLVAASEEAAKTEEAKKENSPEAAPEIAPEALADAPVEAAESTETKKSSKKKK